MVRFSEAAIEIINDLHKERLEYASEYIPLIDAANRLADYEDTGLEPEIINALSDELEQVKLERDAAITLLRNLNWCAGCTNFKGLKGCACNAMSVCDKGNDHYQFDYRFGNPQKEE